MALHLDPIELAARQLERDKRATRDFPWLFERKLERMAVSPLAYLRGSAPLFYELLERNPALAEGPSGSGTLVGDAHLENFGAFRSERAPADETGCVVFDVNDFDEALVGPFRFDVVRLLTSVALAARELGAGGKATVELCHRLLSGYASAWLAEAPRLNAPPAVAHLLAKVAGRTQKDLVDARTVQHGTTRRFVRGDRYVELEPKLAEAARVAFASYVEGLARGRELTRDHFSIEDMALRVAGCGSLGSLRIAVLTRGKGEDRRWIFDMKAEGRPSGADLLPGFDAEPARRVLSAASACLESPPRMLGTAAIDGAALFVRRLSPQEDKLQLEKLQSAELPELTQYLGALLGRVHRRGSKQPLGASWSALDTDVLVEQAIRIAGIHEATYLAFCKSLSRPSPAVNQALPPTPDA